MKLIGYSNHFVYRSTQFTPLNTCINYAELFCYRVHGQITVVHTTPWLTFTWAMNKSEEMDQNKNVQHRTAQIPLGASRLSSGIMPAAVL